jgi:hypothetical protein
MSYLMRLLQKSEVTHQGPDLDIIRKCVVRNKPLQFHPPANPLKLEPHKAIMQDWRTDWQFAAEIAHDAGLLLWTRHDTVFADYPAKVSTFPKAILTYKEDFTVLRDFDCRFKVPENKRGRPKGVHVLGRGRGGKRLTGKSDEAQRGRELVRAKKDLAMHTQARATARAQAQKELDREHAFEITVSALYLRTREADVRDTIRLQQFGKLFSGDYIADKVTHEFSGGHLATTYELHRDVKAS